MINACVSVRTLRRHKKKGRRTGFIYMSRSKWKMKLLVIYARLVAKGREAPTGCRPALQRHVEHVASLKTQTRRRRRDGQRAASESLTLSRRYALGTA